MRQKRVKFRVYVSADNCVRVTPVAAPQGTRKLTVEEAKTLINDLAWAIAQIEVVELAPRVGND